MADDIANDIKPAGDYRYNEYIRADLLIDGKVDASDVRAYLDGRPVAGRVVRHSDIMGGGELLFEMAERPPGK